MQCPTCGSTVSNTASICADCGMELQSETSPLEQADSFSPAPSSESPPSADVQGADATIVLPSESSDDISFDDSDAPASVDSSTPGENPMDPTPAPAASVVAPPARLVLKRNGALTEEIFPLGDRVTVGRFDVDSGPVDIDMASLPEAAYVSRRHAEIWREENQWKIRDLGARNGTFVSSDDGQFRRIVDEQSIKDGDEIAMGNARFEFRVGD